MTKHYYKIIKTTAVDFCGNYDEEIYEYIYCDKDNLEWYLQNENKSQGMVSFRAERIEITEY